MYPCSYGCVAPFCAAAAVRCGTLTIRQNFRSSRFTKPPVRMNWFPHCSRPFGHCFAEEVLRGARLTVGISVAKDKMPGARWSGQKSTWKGMEWKGREARGIITQNQSHNLPAHRVVQETGCVSTLSAEEVR